MTRNDRQRRARWGSLIVGMALLAVAPLGLAAPAAQTHTQQVAAAKGEQGYELPSAALQAVVDAPRAPTLSLSPRRDIAAMLQTPPLPSISVVAQPELKLAGLRINPATHSSSRFSFGDKLWLLNVADGRERQISGLPQPLSIATFAWSPDQKYIAFNQVHAATSTNELWIVDVDAGSARRLVGDLNTVMGDGYSWQPDSRGLLVMQLDFVGTQAAVARDSIDGAGEDGIIRVVALRMIGVNRHRQIARPPFHERTIKAWHAKHTLRCEIGSEALLAIQGAGNHRSQEAGNTFFHTLYLLFHHLVAAACKRSEPNLLNIITLVLILPVSSPSVRHPVE